MTSKRTDDLIAELKQELIREAEEGIKDSEAFHEAVGKEVEKQLNQMYAAIGLQPDGTPSLFIFPKDNPVRYGCAAVLPLTDVLSEENLVDGEHLTIAKVLEDSIKSIRDGDS